MPDWYVTKDGDKTCFALYLRHYSSKKRPKGKRQEQFVGKALSSLNPPQVTK